MEAGAFAADLSCCWGCLGYVGFHDPDFRGLLVGRYRYLHRLLFGWLVVKLFFFLFFVFAAFFFFIYFYFGVYVGRGREGGREGNAKTSRSKSWVDGLLSKEDENSLVL